MLRRPFATPAGALAVPGDLVAVVTRIFVGSAFQGRSRASARLAPLSTRYRYVSPPNRERQ